MSDIITSISSSTTRGSSEEDARLKWNLLEPLTIIKGHISPINAACLYADAKLLVSGDVHGELLITEVKSGRCIKRLKFEEGILRILKVDENACLIQVRNGVLHQFDMVSLTITRSRKCGEYSFCKMQISTTSKVFGVMPSIQGSESLDIWDLNNFCVFLTIPEDEEDKRGYAMCTRLVMDDDEMTIIAGFDDGTVRVFRVDIKVKSFKQVLRLKLFPMTVTCLDYDASTDKLIAGGPQTDLVLIENFLSESSQKSVTRQNICNEGFSDAIFVDDDLIITGGWDGKIRYFCGDTLQLLGISSIHSDTILELTSVYAVDGFPDPRRPLLKHKNILISTCRDKTVSITSLDEIIKKL